MDLTGFITPSSSSSSGNLGSTISSIGTAVQDLFGSEGAAAEANSYLGAAQLAEQNAQLTGASTRIQNTQLARQIFQTEGTQKADVAGAGFTESGSALDLLRSSTQQGALAKSLVNIQGAINENSYAAQAGAYKGAAKAAGEAQTANTIGAIASIGGALLSGSGSLISAGKTVVSGVKYISNSLFGSGDVGDALNNDQVDAVLSENPLDLSYLDSSIATGADIGDNFLSSDFSLDTSNFSIGSSAESAVSDIGDVSNALTDNVGTQIGDIASGVGDSVGNFFSGGLTGIGNIVDDIGNGDILGAVGGVAEDVVGSLLSVICTAFYKRGLISREVWFGCQRYGAQMPRDTFEGYLFWATPIANRIKKSKHFAGFIAPLLVPVAIALAASAGTKVKPSLYGRFAHGVTFTLSWCFGKTLFKRERIKHAETGTN